MQEIKNEKKVRVNFRIMCSDLKMSSYRKTLGVHSQTIFNLKSASTDPLAMIKNWLVFLSSEKGVS